MSAVVRTTKVSGFCMRCARGLILLRLDRLVEAVLLLVGDDADDRDPRIVVLRPPERDALADRVFTPAKVAFRAAPR